MVPTILRRSGLSAVLATAVILAACSDQTTMPTSRTIAPRSGAARDIVFPGGDILACKLSGPAGTYHFHMTIQGGGEFTWVGGPDLTLVFDGVNRACEVMGYPSNQPTWVANPVASVTVAEVQLPPGVQVDSITTYNSLTGGLGAPITGTNSRTDPYTFDDILWFKFYNGPSAPPPPPPPGNLKACKVGGPAGSYTFHVDVVGGGPFTLPSGSNAVVAFNGTTPACATMYAPTTFASWTAGQTASVEISEVNIPTGLKVQSITVVQNGVTGASVTNSSSTAANVAFTDVTSVNFVNAVIPPLLGTQGCTPGYWKVKQHSASWLNTGYAQTQLIGSVFTVPASYTLSNKAMSSYTLLAGLSFQGGSTLSGKAQILFRAAIAGILNAGSPQVNYSMTAAQIVSAVNSALASNDATTITNLATLIDNNNNGLGGCPLN